jgi:23S rRNA (pseudouridine1915-N3)-methyltransferase
LKIFIVHQGKTTDKNLDSLEREYLNRLSHYASVEIKYLPEPKGQLSTNAIRSFEETNLLKLFKPSDLVLLFDEKGKNYSSAEFAQFLQKQFLSGKNIFLVTGGPYGFSEGVYKRADGLISLSAMTFTHQMVRVIIAEQLYRALTILKNEKYHH